MTGKARRDRGRAVIIDGVRTPFTRAFAELKTVGTIDLGATAVRALLQRTGLHYREVDAIVWGSVVFVGNAPNTAREIGLDVGLPPSVEAMTVTRACASGLQAVTLAAAAIDRGEAEVVIAGGSDSTSNAEVPLPPRLVRTLAPLALGKATMGDVLAAMPELLPVSDLVPRAPRIAERTTGQTMGEAAEEMASRNAISREAQDELAVRSHHRAAAGIASGRLRREVTAVEVQGGEPVYADAFVRADTSLEKLARLKPAFRKDGTLTAGNSSPLTDGAAAVLVMSRAKARALGLAPKAAFRSWAYVGVDPRDQLLMGPALAMPKALDRAGMELRDAGLIDLHEAFAAQVLSVVKMLGSEAFARERLGRDTAVGEVDPARLNVWGGSIALGHPFAATGARMVTTMANELHERDAETALLGICAAGGLGAAAVLERA
jgi:acetyl-CoA acyltransferase